jgi:membrane fusion protein, multidrug efflux system
MKDKFEHLKTKSLDASSMIAGKAQEHLPKFWALKQSYRVVIIIVAVVVLWMLSGVFHSKSKNVAENSEQIMVKVINSQATPKKKVLNLNGITKASKVIDIKAETEGIIFSIPVKKGQFLKKGDIIVKLDERNHLKQLEEAEADYSRQLLSYNATKATFDKNLSSAISLADATTRLKAAENAVKSAKDDIEKTISNAPEDGFVDNIYVEEGDFAAVMQSSKFATFLVLNPLQIIAYIPEKNIQEAPSATEANVIFSDKKEVVGQIKFLSKIADAATKTYKVEIELPNEDYKINSGQTVQIKIPLSDIISHHIPRSALNLDMKGDISVKTVDDANKVKIVSVELIDEDADGFWVTGLPESTKIITLGHQYVKNGELVNVNDKVS